LVSSGRSARLNFSEAAGHSWQVELVPEQPEKSLSVLVARARTNTNSRTPDHELARKGARLPGGGQAKRAKEEH
jgi:hypothetical protein